MKYTCAEKKKMRAAASQEYKGFFSSMQFPDEYECGEAQKKRDMLIEKLLSLGTQTVFSGTKLYTGELSPGCRLCGEGRWSCLFITSKCNAACKYCPAPQQEDSLPGTGNIDFTSPDHYAEYVEKFGFKGISISGGEPFLFFQRTLSYIKAVKARVPSTYVWLYTNGILADESKLAMLSEAGVDEIRYDIGAVGYRTDGPAAAVRHIPRVTVEIPVFPPDKDKIRTAMRELNGAGVKYLNLHQLRATPYNAPKLAACGARFLLAPGVTVFESELAALELMIYGYEEKLSIGVHYCSFLYRHLFQTGASRHRYAALIKKPWHETTQTGCIRSIKLTGKKGEIDSIMAELENRGAKPQSLFRSGAESLMVTLDILPVVAELSVPVILQYYAACLVASVSCYFTYAEVRLESGKKLFVERRPVTDEIELSPDEIQLFLKAVSLVSPEVLFLPAFPDSELERRRQSDEKWSVIISSEQYQRGFTEYF